MLVDEQQRRKKATVLENLGEKMLLPLIILFLLVSTYIDSLSLFQIIGGILLVILIPAGLKFLKVRQMERS
ncbi:hypothetical protein P3T75_01785 [Enterococcus montenegrensis]|uniref:hypothetical protein n=1 Tax=Enterococcus montenegrensis TaxID=3031993 RepID=UPI00249F4700|nr:hypothetical protein [Enterococcus montenegrensis]WHA09600.1 hypothetical protein P3T75_01785 [Enterococcus montenegrensis]